MVSSYDLKPALQARLRPLARRLAARGVTPNEVTLAALAFAALGGLLILLAPDATWPLVLLPLILFLRLALDALDGMLAREHGMASDLGIALNEIADVLSDAFLYLPLAAVPGVPAGLIVVTVVFGIIAEMAGVVAAQLSGKRRQDGPRGKSDRAVCFGGIALLLAFDAGPDGAWLQIFLLLMIALIGLSMVSRIRGGLRDAGR
jgi:CDP-diacylglycerol--glycerol-3-phosphate 3-phosphatidyltransferase